MNIKIRFSISIICILCGTPALASESFNNLTTAKNFSESVRRLGATKVVEDLSKSPQDGRWDNVMSNIASGKNEWLEAVPLIWNTSSEGWNEDLESALGSAIPHNPKKVMALLEKKSHINYMQVCAMPIYNKSIEEQNAYVVESMQALYKTNTPMSKKCFNRLIDVVKKSPQFNNEAL